MFAAGSSIEFDIKNKDQIIKSLNLSSRLANISFLLVMLHAIMSFMLFKPEIYTMFFEKNNTISLFGGLTIVSGIIALLKILINQLDIKFKSLYNQKNNDTLFSLPKEVNISMLFIILHILFMRFNGWVTPAEWNGGLPPISLIAFLFITIGLFLKLFVKTENSI